METRLWAILTIALVGFLWPITAACAEKAVEETQPRQEALGYDPETVETFSGEVITVEHYTRTKPYGWEIRLRVREDGNIVPVHIGPTWFLDDYDFYIGEGDRLTITGSRIKYKDESAILASEIKEGEDVLRLRDEKGRPVWTAAGRGGKGWGGLYDAKTRETLDGEILEVGYFSPEQGGRRGVHLKLKSGADIVFVHLGPKWYIENQEMKPEVGDEIIVTGSRIIIDGRPTIIASSVQIGDNVLMLRDKEGYPVWAGWRRAQP